MVANLETIGPDVLSQPLNNNFAALNNAKMEKTADSDLNMNGFKLTNLGAPSANNDAARKVDVDAKVSKSGDTVNGNITFGASGLGLRWAAGDVNTIGAVADFPEVTTGSATAYFFRNTNTSGAKRIHVLKGDGTSTLMFEIWNGEINFLNGRPVKITTFEGDPNGNVAAPPGSICLDVTNGKVYKKATGTGNTGWQELT